MYVILRGSVNILIDQKSSLGHDETWAAQVLYDGNQFGEIGVKRQAKMKTVKDKIKKLGFSQLKKKLSKAGLSDSQKMLKAKIDKREADKKINTEFENKFTKIANVNKKGSGGCVRKRSATVQMAENTFMLKIPNKIYQHIILTAIKGQTTDKIHCLSQLSVFNDISYEDTVFVARFLTKKRYKLGDIILQKGDEKTLFYLISSGKVRKIIENTVYKTKKESQYKRGNKALRTFQFNTKKDFIKIAKDAKMAEKHDNYEDAPELNNTRSFQNEIVKHKCTKDTVACKNHLNIKIHVKYDFLCPEVLLKDHRDEYGTYLIPPKDIVPANYSLIADTKHVVIYTLTKKDFKRFPVHIKKRFLSYLLDDYKLNTFTHNETKAKIYADEIWQKFKKQQTKEIQYEIYKAKSTGKDGKPAKFYKLY